MSEAVVDVRSSSSTVTRKSTKNGVTSSALFPMYVVPVQALLKFDRLPVHEDLLQSGVLEVVHDKDRSIHFISQRWLGADHPDPDRVKLRRLQDVCRQIINGDGMSLFDPSDWEAFSTGASSARTVSALASELTSAVEALGPETFKEDVANGYIWWDYVSVPQRLEEEGAAQRQKEAVSSIPYYIECSAYFWVLVPEAVHTETKQVVGYEDWQERGWCRLEEWGNHLATRLAPPLVVSNAKRLGVMDTADFLTLRSGLGGMALHAACQGRFTCCDMRHRRRMPNGTEVDIRCDKEEIAQVLKRMFDHKVRYYKETGKDLLYRLTKTCAYSVFAGSQYATQPQTVEEIMAEVNVGFPFRKKGKEEFEASPPLAEPLAQAIALRSSKLLHELLKMDADPNEAVVLLVAAQRGDMEMWRIIHGTGKLTEDQLRAGSPRSNITALDRGARCGHWEVCQFLLEVRAEVGPVRKDNGHTPLHTAAEAGASKVCEVLLRAGADKNRKDLRGRTPLMLAAQRLTLFGRSAGKPGCASVLLEAKADPDIADASGRLPAEVAEEDGHSAYLEVFQKFEDRRWWNSGSLCADKPKPWICFW